MPKTCDKNWVVGSGIQPGPILVKDRHQDTFICSICEEKQVQRKNDICYDCDRELGNLQRGEYNEQVREEH